jgi:hypothetical protein
MEILGAGATLRQGASEVMGGELGSLSRTAQGVGGQRGGPSVPQRAALTGVAEAFAAKNRDTPRRNPQRELPGPDALSRPLTTMFARRPKRPSEWLATIARTPRPARATAFDPEVR